MAEVDYDLKQPGWRLPAALIERVDRAYHERKAAGPFDDTKQEFVAGLITYALAGLKSDQRAVEAAQKRS